MNITRREFIVLTVSATAGIGMAAADAAEGATQEAVVDAGPLADFPADRVYDQFRDQGFFVIRRNRQLYALSSVCTHKGCKVRPQEDQSYLCKCHKSRFDTEGRVVNPPAPRDLPRLAVAVDEKHHLLVNLDRTVHAERTQARISENVWSRAAVPV